MQRSLLFTWALDVLPFWGLSYTFRGYISNRAFRVQVEFRLRPPSLGSRVSIAWVFRCTEVYQGRSKSGTRCRRLLGDSHNLALELWPQLMIIILGSESILVTPSPVGAWPVIAGQFGAWFRFRAFYGPIGKLRGFELCGLPR